ncbi:anti-sigma-factor antagonist [Melioribacter roseus P3M-2]|uniref:Anti-sigma factor antagonist n=1 Tax=Melioribacter roseus (strain DSM 23840 / JCM 17771 / VKM B-2668 / P3M-2) TaxID=1191523 RepID=I6ZQY2_MELRP|nr:STAS domain-containing protein [Melioribacter roseus]AFN74464.1 anti-sigma-factor antagonist [Melioribacter roseus P3M-2]
MNVQERTYDDIVLIKLDIDRATIKDAEQLKKIFYAKIEQGFKKVIIDLSKVDFIDSTFLGVLVSALKRTINQGGDLKLVGLRQNVRAMFELTRLHRVFEVYTDNNSAINSFK